CGFWFSGGAGAARLACPNNITVPCGKAAGPKTGCFRAREVLRVRRAWQLLHDWYESLPADVGSFLATIRGRLRRRMSTAPLDLAVNGEACALARGQAAASEVLLVLRAASQRPTTTIRTAPATSAAILNAVEGSPNLSTRKISVTSMPPAIQPSRAAPKVTTSGKRS